MSRCPRLPLFCLLSLAGLTMAPPVAGQVGSALTIVPWAEGDRVEADAYKTFQDGDAEVTGDDVGIVRGVTFGRARFDTTRPGSLSVGWLYDHIHIDTVDSALPERLVNATAAVGMGLGQSGSWDWGFTVGGGFAGDLPFADEDAWFGVASVYARKRISDRRFLLLVLDYDGSRVFLPDIPLPAIQYTEYITADTYYTLGLPFSRVHWEPTERLSVDVTYFIPIGGRALVEYELSEQWHVFGQYLNTDRGFHLDGDDEHRRLFFEQNRLEAGVRYELGDGFEATVAAGWAFEQEFSRGFDSRDRETVRELDDAAFFRVGVNVAF